MMYCKNLNKLIAEIDETDCPNDCRRCKECIELIGERLRKFLEDGK